jgi:hypothetical protein
MKILTWQERCEIHPDHQTGMVSHAMIQARMQEEIDELRQLFANQKPVAMMFKHNKLGTQFTETCGSAIMNHSDWTPLYDHPELLDTKSYLIGRYDGLRELTDEEINKLWAESHEDGIAMQQGFTTQQHYFAHLILKKASEK